MSAEDVFKAIDEHGIVLMPTMGGAVAGYVATTFVEGREGRSRAVRTTGLTSLEAATNLIEMLRRNGN